MARLNYVELPVADIAATKAFYETVLGWSLTDFGPTYASTMTGDTDIGLQGDPLGGGLDIKGLEEGLDQSRKGNSGAF